jgi:hypothetical protein
MKAICTGILITVATCAAGAAESLETLTNERVMVSKMELAILKRSVALLGTNHKAGTPKFCLMVHTEADNVIKQFYTVSASEIEQVLAGDKQSREQYRHRFRMEYEVLRNYLEIYGRDYDLEISYSTAGGEKGFIVNATSFRKRGQAQPVAAPLPSEGAPSDGR